MLILRPVYLVSRFLCWLIFWSWCGFRVEGRRHIPRGPAIIAANHVSYLDPPAVGVAFRRPVRFIAKDELFRLPVLGRWIRVLGTIPVNLSQPLAVNAAVLKTAIHLLRRGELIAIFPEGRRTPTGHVEPAKLGIAFMALKASAPILPVAVIGTREALPPGARRLRRSRITVRIGQPIPVEVTATRPSRQAYEQLAQQVTTSIAQLLTASAGE